MRFLASKLAGLRRNTKSSVNFIIQLSTPLYLIYDRQAREKQSQFLGFAALLFILNIPSRIEIRVP